MKESDVPKLNGDGSTYPLPFVLRLVTADLQDLSEVMVSAERRVQSHRDRLLTMASILSSLQPSHTLNEISRLLTNTKSGNNK